MHKFFWQKVDFWNQIQYTKLSLRIWIFGNLRKVFLFSNIDYFILTYKHLDYKLDCKNYLGFPEQFSNEVLTFGSLLQDCLVPTLGLRHHIVEISTQNFEISIENWNPKDTAKVLLNSSKQNHNLCSKIIIYFHFPLSPRWFHEFLFQILIFFSK